MTARTAEVDEAVDGTAGGDPGRGLVVGVVGAGGIARPHLAAWRALGVRVLVQSLADAGECAREYGAEEVARLEDLLARCDVVDVCTPSDTHAGIVLAAARAGRHVICEKPLSVDRDEAVAMIAACERAGVQLHPGQVVRYFPEYVAAREAVRAGRIGTPAVLRLRRRGARPVRGWFADVSRSGGIIVDQMIHDLDYARWVAGEVETVYAAVVGEAPGPTVGTVVLTHASGALTHVWGGWGLPHEPFGTSFSIAGSRGLVRHSTGGTASLHVDLRGEGDGRGALVPDGGPGGSPFVAELGEFLAACAGGPPPRVTARDSLAALDIALAAVRSADTGDVVPVHPHPEEDR